MPAKSSRYSPCPCQSGRLYQQCCKRAHDSCAESAEALMRSRYSAYALGLVDYIIATTDPDGPQYEREEKRWASEIESFCLYNSFNGLKVVESTEDGDSATVTFTAHLGSGDMREKSLFYRKEGRWYYHSGTSLQ